MLECYLAEGRVMCGCEVWMWVSTTSTYVSVRPVAAFDDAETGVEIFVVVDTNQHTCCAPRKSVQANVGRTKEETCARVWVRQVRMRSKINTPIRISI